LWTYLFQLTHLSLFKLPLWFQVSESTLGHDVCRGACVVPDVAVYGGSCTCFAPIQTTHAFLDRANYQDCCLVNLDPNAQIQFDIRWALSGSTLAAFFVAPQSLQDRHILVYVLRWIASFLHSSPFPFKARFFPGSVAATETGLMFRTTVDVLVTCIPE